MKKIFIVHSGEWTKEMILDDLLFEGFRHKFKLDSDCTMADEMMRFIEEAEEVWIFGDVCDKPAYIYSASKGKDIWKMG